MSYCKTILYPRFPEYVVEDDKFFTTQKKCKNFNEVTND